LRKGKAQLSCASPITGRCLCSQESDEQETIAKGGTGGSHLTQAQKDTLKAFVDSKEEGNGGKEEELVNLNSLRTRADDVLPNTSEGEKKDRKNLGRRQGRSP